VLVILQLSSEQIYLLWFARKRIKCSLLAQAGNSGITLQPRFIDLICGQGVPGDAPSSPGRCLVTCSTFLTSELKKKRSFYFKARFCVITSRAIYNPWNNSWPWPSASTWMPCACIVPQHSHPAACGCLPSPRLPSPWAQGGDITEIINKAKQATTLKARPATRPKPGRGDFSLPQQAQGKASLLTFVMR